MAEKQSILIVDDDDDARAMVRTILSSNGYTVEEASGGRQALERLKEGFDANLILLDVMMPEMNGYDVLVRLKQQPATQNIPVIMLTAKSENEDVFTAYKDYGVDYYITKPFTTRQLLSGIKLVLS